MVVVGACSGAGALSGDTAGPGRGKLGRGPGGQSVAAQASRLRAGLVFSEAERGHALVFANYGHPNPACWTVATAPTKVKRRLAPLVRGGASAKTQLCYLEYVRKGTHDDVLIKTFVFVTAAEAEAALGSFALQRKEKQLRKHGLQGPRRQGNVVYYVTASASNLVEAQKLSALMPQKLKGLGW